MLPLELPPWPLNTKLDFASKEFDLLKWGQKIVKSMISGKLSVEGSVVVKSQLQNFKTFDGPRSFRNGSGQVVLTTLEGA